MNIEQLIAWLLAEADAAESAAGYMKGEYEWSNYLRDVAERLRAIENAEATK